MAKRHAVERSPMPVAKAGHLLHPLRRLILSPKQLVRRLDLQPDFTVLEIGPGPGYFSIEVARAVPKGRLILVDVQPEMLEMARARVVQAGLTNVDCLVADALSLPLDSGVIDVAFLVSVLGEIPEPLGALQEIRRVLRPGGLLSLTEHTLGDPHSLPESKLQEMAEQAGFRKVRTHGYLLSRTLNFRS